MRLINPINVALIALTAGSTSAQTFHHNNGGLYLKFPLHRRQETNIEKTLSIGENNHWEKKAAVRGGDGGSGTATIPEEVFNLVKNIVGAGVLSLPAGIAAFGSAPSAAIPSSLLITFLGLVSAYSFSIIGRVCSYTGASTFRQAWDMSVGESTSWIPAVTSTSICIFANTAYSMILADTFKSLLKTMGLDLSRIKTLLAVTVLVLLPLCLLKSLSSLAPFSLIGIIGMVYTVAAMILRYFGGGYSLPEGNFLADLSEEFQPVFGDKGGFSSVLSPKVLILVCMLSSAYMAHFNAPKFYVELKENTMKRFSTVIGCSFFISIVFYVGVAVIGFLTFGANSSGLILNNYSTSDGVMSLSRIAVALSIVFSYPLTFVGARDGVLDLLKISPTKRSDSLLDRTTFVLLTLITVIAFNVENLGFLLSILGATCGNALVYIYPGMMFRSVVKDMGDGVSFLTKIESNVVAPLLLVIGLTMGIIGAKMSVDSLSD